jgi:aspartokinase
MARALFDVLGRHRVHALLTAISASSVALVVDSRELGGERERDFLEEVALLGEARAERDKAIITLVGEQLRNDTRMAMRVFTAISETEIGVVVHGSSPISMSLVVAEREVESVIARLHDVFFSQTDPQVFE